MITNYDSKGNKIDLSQIQIDLANYPAVQKEIQRILLDNQLDETA